MHVRGGRSFVPLPAVGIALVLAACTDDGTTAPTIAPATTTTTTTVPARVDDGELSIAVLAPLSGPGATLGEALNRAVREGADAINAAGGVLGRPVLVSSFNEGDSPATARDAVAAIIDEDVDAVIGPASSTIALATLGDLLDAGILTCSPTATALALDNFPDRSLFIRTAPSDSLQATAIAAEAERTGAITAAVAYLDDGYGRPLAEETITALRSRGIAVPDQIGFSADDEALLDEATTIQGSDAGVIIVIGDAEHGTRLLSSLGEVTGAVPGEDQPRIIVNDALRRPPSPQPIIDLAPDVRARIVGLAPAAWNGVAGEPPGPFATNALDCLNLIALAAVQADSDDPSRMAALISAISDGGVSCRDFAECVGLVESGRPNIDYAGPGGGVEIGPRGDPVTYRFERWSYDERGTDVPISNLSPGLPAS